MLLVFDVGNTNIVMGTFEEDALTFSWRMSTDKDKSSDEYVILINQMLQYQNIQPSQVHDVIVSSVVPDLMYSLEHAIRKLFKLMPLLVEPGIKTGMAVLYDNPKQVGADRIVNAVASMKKYGGPLIIVDFGTATTFCAISKDGQYLGGTIAPGIKISSDALFQKAAKLPRIDLVKPGQVICKNTVNSMQSGIIYGYVGLVEHIVKKMKIELSPHDPEGVKVIATGGLSTLISSETQTIDVVDKSITLDGLKVIYDMNREGRNKEIPAEMLE
ncbi:MAG: type III pantothenate kinase [Bacillota bacterium]|nr:type III pantothenate kinase [Bacillota bacterium]MDW7678579.1 type III pantothenate kinase [Bacillota bacterium]